MLADFKRTFRRQTKKSSRRITTKLFLFCDWKSGSENKSFFVFLSLRFIVFLFSHVRVCRIFRRKEKLRTKQKGILSISSDLIKTFRFLFLTNAWLVISLRQVFFMPLRHVLTAFLIVLEKCDLRVKGKCVGENWNKKFSRWGTWFRCFWHFLVSLCGVECLV